MTSHRKLILAAAAAPLALVCSSHAATLWTTTFSGTVNNAGNASRTITNTPAGSFTDTLSGTTSALTRSSTGGNFFLTSPTGVTTPLGPFVNGFNYYNPNQNVDNASGASWNSIFDFGAGSQTVSLTDVTFNVYRFNSGGVIQASDVNVRDVNISAEYTLNGGTDWTPLAATKLVNLTASNSTALAGPVLALNFAPDSPVVVDMASDNFQIRYTAINANANAGAFNGITSMVFSGTVVPEPSVALLGGLGLLGLLRRRRA